MLSVAMLECRYAGYRFAENEIGEKPWKLVGYETNFKMIQKCLKEELIAFVLSLFFARYFVCRWFGSFLMNKIKLMQRKKVSEEEETERRKFWESENK